MKVGIPKGLLYHKYHPFAKRFFNELGSEIITSEDTNKTTLNEGTKYCVDEACLPIKIFHGHVANIKDKCDLLLVPRIMSVHGKEFICPKFCGLPEMVVNTIPNLPMLTTTPIYADSSTKLFGWCQEVGKQLKVEEGKIKHAYRGGIEEQRKHKIGFKDESYSLNVALVGHPYNVYDNFSNMNIIKKLNALGIGVRTEESVDEVFIDGMSKELYKKPFWTFARRSYGYATYVGANKKVDGIVYISSFGCGIDSVVIELIKNRLEHFPILVIKIDEHTGEAGLNTRVEAFVDMLLRRS